MKQMMPTGKHAAVYPEFMFVCFGTYGVCIQSRRLSFSMQKDFIYIFGVWVYFSNVKKQSGFFQFTCELHYVFIFLFIDSIYLYFL